MTDLDVEISVHEAAGRARAASATLALLSRSVKDEALTAIADSIVAGADAILAANDTDCRAAQTAGVQDIDRLRLTRERVLAMADGVRGVSSLPDPIGEVVRGSTLSNGLQLRQVRVPMGVIGMIYEARPNVTSDAAAICLKSGNAVLLRGSSSAAHSNAAIVEAIREGLDSTGLPEGAVQLLPSEHRSSATHLMRARGLVDLVIPRGGAGLIASVVENSTVPVIETGMGNCHVYVDADADLDLALDIVVNSKVNRPSVCNAAESLIVHRAVVDDFLPRVIKALTAHGVTIHGDEDFRAIDSDVVPVMALDDDTEYLSLDISARVVDSVDAAIAHVRSHSSGHTEAIVTRSLEAADRFSRSVDAAVVMVNASTRFTDGEEFGFGAEIGISTQKLHARGPMGLTEMTTTTYIVTGSGQTR